ncbi:MAG TPA: hypothetical protein VJR50_04860 [Mycobacterium sp.]|nr:hypothetical protein [Mycobacterium sp.]
MVLSILAAIFLCYLAVIASWPQLRSGLPPAARWFGQPNSAVTIAIVVAVLVALGAVLWRSGSDRRPGAPVAIVAGLALIATLLGLASYWRCHDEQNPTFFTPVIWTVGLVKSATADRSLATGLCPAQTPVALDIAQLCALAAVFLAVFGAALAVFRSRFDRLRVYFARSITAIVDLDDDALSMVSAVARSMGRRSTLAVLVANPDRPAVADARAQGARIIVVDISRSEALTSLSFWRKLDRLYLLSPDPSSNLLRLRAITARLAEVGVRQRIPLIVRIDDPWQAEVWRAQHFGGAETRWAADAVGKYEVTARQLLDRIIESDSIRRVFVCGTSRLTLALCSDVAQRQLERNYYADPLDPPLPQLVLVAENAEEYEEDHEHSRRRLGMGVDDLRIEAVPKPPTVSVLSALLKETDAAATAVILVDADGSKGSAIDATTGTRLAARFPATPVYAWDPEAEVTEDRLSIVGKLRTYRLSMDMPQGQAQDAWERAAQLIHDRYAAESGGRSAASVPWTELDEFYRESNRRQVRNALWMVERIGGHTWNVWDDQQEAVSVTNMRGLEPLEQLRLMGFDRDAATAMARAEHEDWCRFYEKAGWRHGTPRDDARKIHDKLVDWQTIEADPERLDAALSSLATTLIRLRELGYRSRPTTNDSMWQSFRQVGTVLAEQRLQPWTWTTRSGDTVSAQAGDWEVHEGGNGNAWSVRDDIFRARYEHIDGDQWRRRGVVTARPARAGEVVETLEGRVTAADGDWVVRGEQGDQWPVPADEFARRYETADG